MMSLTQSIRLPTPAAIEHGASVDLPFLLLVITLLCLGIVMVGSASIDYSAHNYHDPFMLLKKHVVYVGLAIMAGMMVFSVPSTAWEKYSGWLLSFGCVLLILVLVPGIGLRVNGSRRWIGLAGLTLQVSELAKLFLILYLSAYLVRRENEIRATNWGFVKPMLVLGVVAFLLLLEPDFGSMVVMMLTALSLIFLAGVPVWHFVVVAASGVVLVSLVALLEPYRWQRLTSFTDPWANQYDSGYQLSQSLIAFGRGEWFGVGLGNSVQKLFYLPEAHTDFVFSIWAEETGLLGSSVVLGAYMLLVYRMLQFVQSALSAQRKFCAYVIFGIALLVSFQAFINIGVTSGLLPTKGLTLPFISYGGSSLIVCCAMMGIVARIRFELAFGDRLASTEKLSRSQPGKKIGSKKIESKAGESDEP